MDLAFLLLIAFTQIGHEVDPAGPDLAELAIPRIASSAPALAQDREAPRWQLRVHPTEPGDETAASRTPFELIEPGRASGTLDGRRPTQPIDTQDLAARLELLRQREVAKPVLAPHRDSRSEDLLVAVALIEDLWEAGRSAVVVPAKSAPRDVASAAGAGTNASR